MSYSPAPKSAYGDSEFTDDSWSQQQPSQPTSFQSQDYAPRDQSTLRQPTTNYRSETSATAAGQQRNPNLMAAPSDFSSMAKSITQEDILFMRGWQRDSFVKRVLPLTAISSGALYLYNKQKNLPQKVSRYLMIATAAYVVGKWSYRDEFKRRLIASQSNTPYMQALRRAIGLPPNVDNSDFDTSTSGFGSANWAPEDPSKSLSGSFGSQHFSGGNLNQNHGFDNQGMDSAKPTTSYEELRAKNRGYIR